MYAVHLLMYAVRCQVKVWVGENLVHYYVLSRFLISRMLTVTKIPQMKVGERWVAVSSGRLGLS